MPLIPGSSTSVISENIREMRAAGHPEDQAVAASLRNARGPKKRKTPGRRHPGLHKDHPFNRNGMPEPFGTKESM